MDSLSPAERSEIMARVRAKNSRPELLVRKLVYAQGYRYRLHARELPGRPIWYSESTERSYLYTAVSGIGTRNAH